jgi:hypothetical protein
MAMSYVILFPKKFQSGDRMDEYMKGGELRGGGEKVHKDVWGET